MLRCTLLFFATIVLAQAGERLAWTRLPSLPDALGVAGAFAGVSDDRLLVAGGANFPERMPWAGGSKVWHDRVWVLNRRPDGEWVETGRLPRPLAYGVSGTWRGRVVCAGGSDHAGHHADVFTLRITGGGLEVGTLPPLPIPLSASCGTIVGDTLYVIGGAREPGETAAESRAFALNLAESIPRWRELPPLPGPGRFLSIAAAHEDSLYVFGGVELERGAEGKMARVYLRESWRFTDGGWRRLADLPKPAAAAPSPAPCVDGRVFILAGDDGSRRNVPDAERHPGFVPAILVYDIKHDRWSEAGEAPAPRATTAVVRWRDLFVIPSGEVRPGVRSPETWALHFR